MPRGQWHCMNMNDMKINNILGVQKKFVMNIVIKIINYGAYLPQLSAVTSWCQLQWSNKMDLGCSHKLDMG